MENPDLWRALRGGSSNFGIVIQFVLQSFSQGPFWGGHVYYPITTVPQQLKAFSDFNSAGSNDEYASLIQTFAYSGGVFVTLNAIHYTKPVVNPPALHSLTKIQPQLASTMRTSTVTSFTTEENSNLGCLR